ncbi:MAG: RNA-directed DNA polymerase [Thermomicrobiales bacterium]
MSQRRPEAIAVRAVNQYRYRDVFTFLGLRYYLENTAARTDRWARYAAAHLVRVTNTPAYGRVYHFKEMHPGGRVEHRELHLPGPNEALAEAALLDECARHTGVFGNPPQVYSYELNTGRSREGVFRPYYFGLRRRQQSIAEACRAYPDGEVLFVDIAKFYPSIEADLAASAWARACERAGIATVWRELGEFFLYRHASAQSGSAGVLTGPMFSHLIGNLVLRGLDEWALGLPVRYHRYVDDLTLVGPPAAVGRARQEIADRLQAIGFGLHPPESPKTLSTSTREVYTARNDFSKSNRSVSWMSFIGDLKRYLVINPGGVEGLRKAFASENLRIPVWDYSGTTREVGYLERLRQLWSSRWVRKRSAQVSVQSLVRDALTLRAHYTVEVMESLVGISSVSAFERKRRVPHLRYRTGRLTYLATESGLSALSHAVSGMAEMNLQAAVMKCVATGDITQVLRMGANAAQGAAQPLAAANKATHGANTNEVGRQALAVFDLNGVSTAEVLRPEGELGEWERFARSGGDAHLMQFGQRFIRELACLHGNTLPARHPAVLTSAFDYDDEIAFDTLNVLNESASV